MGYTTRRVRTTRASDDDNNDNARNIIRITKHIVYRPRRDENVCRYGEIRFFSLPSDSSLSVDFRVRDRSCILSHNGRQCARFVFFVADESDESDVLISIKLSDEDRRASRPYRSGRVAGKRFSGGPVFIRSTRSFNNDYSFTVYRPVGAPVNQSTHNKIIHKV